MASSFAETAGPALSVGPTTQSRRKRDWLLALLAAAALVPLSNGRWTVAAAAWLAPLFLLHFVRSQPPLRGLAVVYAVFLAWFPLQWASMIPLEGAALWLLAVGFELLFLLPYAVDRWLAPRIGGLTSTLVFPLAWTSLEYAIALASPYTTWGSVAYTQYGNSPLLQLLSITGLWGVTFLVCWFASVGSWAWSNAGDPRRALGGLLAYGAVLALVLLLGGARLAFFPPTAPTIRVASLTIEPGAARRAWNMRREGVPPAVLATVRRETLALHDKLLERSAAEARAGAQLVFWAELNGLVLKDDEPALIERGRELARRENVYLGMALGAITPGEYLMENKLVVVDPSGNVAATYHKARPVPGDPETGASAAIPTFDTRFGRLALGICYDLDFPHLIREAGAADADLLIAPARDSDAMSPMHTRMALFRAVENGFALVRHTDQGLSAAVDRQGRELATMDHFATTDRVMHAHVPTRGARTIYALRGDVFAWACIAGLCALAAVGLVKKDLAT